MSPTSPRHGQNRLCTWPGCGKTVRDLASHLSSHQCRRPFNCPVRWCDYFTKGFARKYDRNRHALSHWKAVTRCKFCPESSLGLNVNFFGLNELKSHLKHVHEAKATHKTSSGAPEDHNCSGSITCSACQRPFFHVQTFYSHLDDCVLKALERDNPIDDINTQNLALVANDEDVVQTLAQHGFSCFLGPDHHDDAACGTSLKHEHPSPIYNGIEMTSASNCFPHKPDEDDERLPKGIGIRRSVSRCRNRSEYPPSWGSSNDKMTARRRRLVMFDGTERLHAETTVFSRDNEVHVELSDGNTYITDVDLQTLSRVIDIELMKGVGAADAVVDNTIER